MVETRKPPHLRGNPTTSAAHSVPTAQSVPSERGRASGGERATAAHSVPEKKPFRGREHFAAHSVLASAAQKVPAGATVGPACETAGRSSRWDQQVLSPL